MLGHAADHLPDDFWWGTYGAEVPKLSDTTDTIRSDYTPETIAQIPNTELQLIAVRLYEEYLKLTLYKNKKPDGRVLLRRKKLSKSEITTAQNVRLTQMHVADEIERRNWIYEEFEEFDEARNRRLC